jgi:tetratricopeptide (TPR) repeat protein/DNA-binding winged helix-turn-helix (wHTH) protein
MKVLDRQIYRFDGVEVDPSHGCLRRGGEELFPRQKVFQVLLYLLEERHRLVTKEELIERIWEGVAVSDGSLVQLIKEIRRSLGDDPRHPRFIKTLPKVGYRFIAPVEELFPDPSTTIEIERHASVEIEFEEEIIGVPMESVETEARPITIIPLAAAATRRRNTLMIAVATVLLIVSALTAYLMKKSRPRSDQLSEVTMPRVPGKETLAVMYFKNQSGGADLDWLRGGLVDMLITDLSRSKQLSVLSREQLHLLLERTGHDPESNVRLDEALEAARRINVERVVLGSFAGVDGKIRVDVELYDTRTGSVLTAEHIIADQPNQILTQIDLLALKLAPHLNSATRAGQNPEVGLSDVMTDNLEAYRYYSLAVEKAQGFHSGEAIALLERAVALDPQFAMAHARIGYTFAVTLGFTDKAKPHLEKAFRLSDRLTEKDRLYITAWYSIANLDYAGAIKSFQEITAKYPLEIEAYEALARLLRGEERLEEAIEVTKQALAIDAGAKNIYNALGTTYSELGRHDEALAMLRRYVELAPDEPNAHDSLGLGYQWAGHYMEAIQEYEGALALNPRFEVAVIHLGNTYFQQGRYREAITQYRRYTEIAASDFGRARGYSSIAFVHWKKGDLNEAAAAARKSLKYDKSSQLPHFLLALMGSDPATAAKLQEQFFNQWPYSARGTRLSARSLSYYQGYFNLKQGESTQAINHFKEAVLRRPQIWDIDPLEDCLANAYLELGRTNEAIAEYERILRLNPNYPLAHYHLAQAYEQKGLSEQARAEYGRFLQIWKGADADLPAVTDARKQLAG